jgi:hypothetical protein
MDSQWSSWNKNVENWANHQWKSLIPGKISCA